MTMPSRVTITEVGPRDGLQNEGAYVEPARKVELIDRLAAAGLRRIEATSFVHPKAIPQLRDAAAVMAALPRRAGVTYTVLVPNEIGAGNAIAAKADELATVVAASETMNQKNVNRTIAESLAGFEGVAALAAKAGVPWVGYVSTAFGCPYEGGVSPATVIEVAKRIRALGARGIALGDTIGAGNPRQVKALVRTFRDALPDTPLRIHFHDTRGTGLANVLAALGEGVDHFDGSLGDWGAAPMRRAPPATSRPRTWSTCWSRWGLKPGGSARTDRGGAMGGGAGGPAAAGPREAGGGVVVQARVVVARLWRAS